MLSTLASLPHLKLKNLKFHLICNSISCSLHTALSQALKPLPNVARSAKILLRLHRQLLETNVSISFSTLFGCPFPSLATKLHVARSANILEANGLIRFQTLFSGSIPSSAPKTSCCSINKTFKLNLHIVRLLCQRLERDGLITFFFKLISCFSFLLDQAPKSTYHASLKHFLF